MVLIDFNFVQVHLISKIQANSLLIIINDYKV